MKRLIQKAIILALFLLILTSCAIIRRGCSCTAKTQKTVKKVPITTLKADVVTAKVW
jgi:hypothetical protein